jgi:hypothetical protein
MKSELEGQKSRRAVKALLGGVLFTLCLQFFAGPVNAKLAPETRMPEYKLQVAFDIPQSKMKGKATIIVPKGRRLNIYFDELEVLNLKVNGRSLELRKLPDPTEFEVAGGVIEITYEGVFKNPETSIIDQQGIILRDIWYPLVAGPCLYTLFATLPADYEALSEANYITRSPGQGTVTFRFEFPHPLSDSDGLTFSASRRYQVSRTDYRGIELSTYLFPEDLRLAEKYLDQTRKFLEIFERLLGPYPYRRLAIVESFQPSAYSMPTYILIGREKLELDELATSTLAHEILHQWFGNSIFTDFDRGNWNEGLTIYLADHFLEEEKSNGWQCRRRILSNFKTHVNSQNEIPLRKFSEREDDVTRSVGYGKSAMVFHMLRRHVGDEAFFAAIRDFVQQHSFRMASWDDLKKTFEKRTNQQLSWFFRQWLNGVGLPSIHIEDAKVHSLGKNFRVTVNLKQIGGLYKLRVPIIFYRDQVSQQFWINLNKRGDSFSFLLDFQPHELVIDENFEVFRRLSLEEDPATFKRLITASREVHVLPPVPQDIFDEIRAAFQKKGIALKIDRGDAGSSTRPRPPAVLLLGREHPLIPSFFGDLKINDQGFSAVIRKSPYSPRHLVAVFHASDPKEVEDSLKEMFFRQFFSEYVFRGGRLLSRTLQETERGMRIKLAARKAEAK